MRFLSFMDVLLSLELRRKKSPSTPCQTSVPFFDPMPLYTPTTLLADCLSFFKGVETSAEQVEIEILDEGIDKEVLSISLSFDGMNGVLGGLKI